MNNRTLPVFPLLVFLASMWSGVTTAQTAFFQAVTNLNPTGYWPMREIAPPAPGSVETNYGTLGAPGTAYYGDWVTNKSVGRQIGGALANDSNPAAAFPGSRPGFLLVPHTSPATTLVPPFTIECWAYPTNTAFGDIVAQAGATLNGAGNDGNKNGIRLLWQGNNSVAPAFQVFVGDGTAQITLMTDPGATPYAANRWYYLVLTCDASTNFSLHVNGSGNVLTNTSTAVTMVPSSWNPLTIGGGWWDSRGYPYRMFAGYVDEVAIYTNVLMDADISAHYTAGTNGAAGDYKAAVLTGSPLLYYRMDSPAYTPPSVSAWPVLANYGSAPLNGVYRPGATPGSVSGPTTAAGAYAAGFGTQTKATAFNGLSTFADAGFDPAFNPTTNTPITVSAWFRGNLIDPRFQTLVGHSDKSWRISMDTTGKLRFNAGAGGEVTATKGSNDGRWHQVTGVFDGATNYLYIDGVLNKQVAAATNYIAGSTASVLIGADPQYTNSPAGPGRQFAGTLCEVAFWNGTALSASQVKALYLTAGINLPPTVATITNNVATGLPAKVTFADLQNSAWLDPERDLLTLSGTDATSANGVSLTTDAAAIYYNAPVTALDHFAYTVTDGYQTVGGVVYLKPVASVGTAIQNAATDGSGHPVFNGSSIPGYVYGVESTHSLTPPIVWSHAGTVTAGADGKWAFTDMTNAPPVYYRLYYPSNPGNPPQ